MLENYIIELTEEEQKEVITAINTLKTVLMPKLVDLNNSEIKQLAKMGDKTMAFVEKAIVHMEQNPSLVPTYVDVAECKKDVEGVSMLREFNNSLEQITEMVGESMMLCGSEAYTASLAFYNAVKGAAKAKVPGAEVIYNDLRKRFIGAKKVTSEE